MKKIGLSLLGLSFVLVGCGGNDPLGLDGERLQEGVVDRAMNNAQVEEGGYTEEDIELARVCAAVPNGDEAYGHQGDYVVFWQTSDGKVQHQQHFNESDYFVDFGANQYEEYEDIGCHDFD